MDEPNEIAMVIFLSQSSPGPTKLHAFGGPAVLAALFLLITGCAQPPQPIPNEFLKPPPPAPKYTATEALRQFAASSDPEYRLGEGDSITIQVWDRPDLSGSQVVGPDGAITVPVAGTLRIIGKTREEATQAVKDSLSKYYSKVSVTVRVDRYASNRIIVLGQVRTPGVLQFDTMPTLLEALARAGGVVPADATSNLTHCAIVRGGDRVAWVDLRGLLKDANLSLNVKLKPNDVLFVPDRTDMPVYVLGQVLKPGPYRWNSSLTVLDALALAGGSTRHANSTLQIVSPSRGLKTSVDMTELQSGIKGHNVTLQAGDILYLPTSGMADVGYVLEQLDPFGWIFLGSSIRAGATD